MTLLHKANVSTKSFSASPASPRRRFFTEGLPTDFLRLELDQRHFACGDAFVTLHRRPRVIFHRAQRTFEVEGWNIILPFERRTEIAREIVRKFLRLFAKAENQTLSEIEEAEWANIIPRVDYRKFWDERAPTTYMEGRLLDRCGPNVTVEWSGGDAQQLGFPAAKALLFLDVGERFKAMVQFGRDGGVMQISGATPLPDIDSSTAEAFWAAIPDNSQ